MTSTPDQPALAGAWAVSSQGESFVGYRVKQTVAGVDAPTRVGRTPAVTASAEFSSDDLASMALDADLLQLTSGDDRRDAIFSDLLETETFPTASFVLISGVPTEELVDASASVDVVAELTLHGVTRAITLTLEGETNGDLVVLVGSTEILFRGLWHRPSDGPRRSLHRGQRRPRASAGARTRVGSRTIEAVAPVWPTIAGRIEATS